MLTSTAAEAVRKHLGYYAHSADVPQNSDLLQDADGQYFLNYLDNTILIEPEGLGPWYDMLVSHKERIEERLTKHRGEPAICSKYAWVARYHNYFSNIYPRFFEQEHKIDVAKL